MIVHKAAHTSDTGEQALALAADPFSFLIKRFAWEEGEAARREDWSAARAAAIKKVILQEARARLLASRFV